MQFDELYKKYARKMLPICKRYMGASDAEDVFQEAWIKVFDKVGSYELKNPEGFLRRIFINTCLNAIRDRKINFSEIESCYDLAAEEFSSSYRDYLDVDGATLHKLIENMPEGYRIVFSATLDGYSHAEIGEILNIQESSSRSQYRKARLYLQEKLKK